MAHEMFFIDFTGLPQAKNVLRTAADFMRIWL
jgi:hypothetical protein